MIRGGLYGEVIWRDELEADEMKPRQDHCGADDALETWGVLQLFSGADHIHEKPILSRPLTS